MVAFYQLFACYATLEFYQMAEPVLSPYSLGIALFSSGFLLNLRGTIGLPTKHVSSGCFLLHDQPSLGQQLFFPADHEYFYFLSTDPCYYGDMHPKHG